MYGTDPETNHQVKIARHNSSEDDKEEQQQHNNQH